MAYGDKVLDHYENPRNVGSMDKNDPSVGTGLVSLRSWIAPIVLGVVTGPTHR